MAKKLNGKPKSNTPKRNHFPKKGTIQKEILPMLNKHNITNSALFIPMPSTKMYFPNLYVQTHPKNQQNNII